MIDTLEKPSTTHVSTLNNELNWLIEHILLTTTASETVEQSALNSAPSLEGAEGLYAQFVRDHDLSDAERLVLVLALAPHLRPGVFREFFDEPTRKAAGLVPSESKVQLLPTAETALYLLAGVDLGKRLRCLEIFDTAHLFYKKSVLDINNDQRTGTAYDGELKLKEDYVDRFLFNKVRTPKYSSDFPAHPINTALTWDDLVLNPSTAEKIEEMKAALQHRNTLQLDWGLGGHLKPGYRAIFYGPSGTGKSLTAGLLGRMLDKEVFKVDLSAIISKYIGETEENIRKLLTKSEDKDYMLFFDEGDALFGSRSESVVSANDHHHNQLIAYLLQAIENFNGVIILASNLKQNMDSAFTRRFQTSIFFGPPKPEQGEILWKKLWPKQLTPDPSVNFKALAVSKPFTAAVIVQIINGLALRALRTGRMTVKMTDVKLVVDELQRK